MNLKKGKQSYEQDDLYASEYATKGLTSGCDLEEEELFPDGCNIEFIKDLEKEYEINEVIDDGYQEPVYQKKIKF